MNYCEVGFLLIVEVGSRDHYYTGDSADPIVFNKSYSCLSDLSDVISKYNLRYEGEDCEALTRPVDEIKKVSCYDCFEKCDCDKCVEKGTYRTYFDPSRGVVVEHTRKTLDGNL